MSAAKVNRVNAEAPIETAELLMDAVARSGQRKIGLITSEMGAHRGLRGGTPSPRRRTTTGSARAPTVGAGAAASRSSSTRAGMGSRNATISVAESASGVHDVMAGLDESQHGRFRTWDGRVHPW